MPAKLTVAVSSRALFHIEDGHDIFELQGQAAFDEYMRSKETTPLRPGTAFPLIRKLLALNPVDGPPLVDVVMLSRNSPDAGMRIMNSVDHYKLPIERAIFSKGGDRFRYAAALGAQLFLSANPGDVKLALNKGIAAATMLPSERGEDGDDGTIRIAFDGDSVLFDSTADECYQAFGLAEFRRTEFEKADIPLGAGPFKPVIEALHDLQKSFPSGECPMKVAMVTARELHAHYRPMRTLRSWGIELDEAIFAAGRPKGPLLRAFGADVFFDDTQKNINSAADHDIPSGHVPFGNGQGIVAVDSLPKAA
jgi:5'-nucleotidase